MGIKIDFGTQKICPNNKDGHVAAWSSLHIDVASEDEAFIDVNCIYCGRSGCIAVINLDQSKIDW